MPRMQWKVSRVIAISISLIILYFIVRIRNYQHKTFVFLSKIQPNEAWEFVADFSNMKYLNPTIVDFNIIEESGNYDHWKYTTEYWEYLSHWPHLPNHAIASFNIKTNAKKDEYFIESIHKTCFLFGLFCLDSQSQFKFVNSNSSTGTVCEEFIIYQCPAIMHSFCRREVIFQRNAIMNNLKKHFFMKNNIKLD